MIPQAKVIENDALVVLCLTNQEDQMTHHEFKLRAKLRGHNLSKSQCHNMLHRATGRVYYTVSHHWYLTAAGMAYRTEVLTQIVKLLTYELGEQILSTPTTTTI